MFEWAHLYVWQALIMLDVLIVWLVWVRTLPAPRDAGRRLRRRPRRRPPPRDRFGARSLGRSPARRASSSPCCAGCRSTFAVWYFAAPVLLLARRASGRELVARRGFGDLVRAVEQAGVDARRSSTSLRPGQAVAGGVVSVDVNMLLYSFGLPLFARAHAGGARAAPSSRVLLIGYRDAVAVRSPAACWPTS